MPEPHDPELEEEQAAADDEDGRGEPINDPLTRSDVEAPRVPFGSGAEPQE